MFSWSPDGRLLRFTRAERGISGSTMWELHSDGTSLRRLITGWNKLPDEWGGSWTPDGRYFLFHSTHAGSRDVWAIQEKGFLFRRSQMEPIRLSAGPTDYTDPLVSSDGRKVFVYGSSGLSEYLRYDLKSRQFVPILPGLRARGVSFSPDGDWIAYGSWQDSSLVRRRVDGTQQLAITSPSLWAESPRWSPDGKQIAFDGLRPSGTNTILIVSSNGGAPAELLTDGRNERNPMWSPDGQLLAFSREEASSASGRPSPSLYVFHLSTKQLSPLPGSEGLSAPSWSPDGQFIAAKSEDEHRLMLFSFHTQEWIQLARANLVFGLAWWSKDSKSLFYQDLLAPGEPIYRLFVANHRQEIVATFDQFLRGSASRGAFLGLGPDESLLAVLSRNDSDIYALDLDLP